MHSTPSDPLPILLTRPQADAAQLAQTLMACGAAEVVISPLLRIVTVGPLPPLPGDLIFTSVNGVMAFAELGGRPGHSAWVVGPRTAEVAASVGCHVRQMAPDAATLAQVIPSHSRPLTHLRGDVQRGDLAAELRARGLSAVSQVIYRSEAVPLSEAAHGLIERGRVLAPLYSPRSAALLFAAVPTAHHARISAICLSAAVAEVCPVRPLAVSETPDGAAMLQTIQHNLRSRAVEGPGPTV